MLAQEESRRLGHNYVGTEQILLGLMGEGSSIAAKVLKSMGVTLKDARIEVQKIIGRGNGNLTVEIPFTPRANQSMEIALEESYKLGNFYVGPEHLLIGIVRDGERSVDTLSTSVAYRALQNLGVDISRLLTLVMEMIGTDNSSYLSPELYLEGERVSPIKHEYRRGQVYAMTGAKNPHTVISVNLVSLLVNHLLDTKCLVFIVDTKVRLEEANCYYYPDVAVTCDERDITSLQDFILYPSLIIEVLSPSTAAFKRYFLYALQ